MKHSIILLFALMAACSPSNNPFVEVEPTTTDPVIRARELNDSAIDLFTKNQKLNGDAALLIFDDAMALDSTYDKPLINKIAVLMQLRRFDEATKVAEKLHKLRPVDAELTALSGWLYRLQSDTANAVVYFGEAIKQLENQLVNLDANAPVYQMQANKLALLYWAIGNKEKCEALAPGMTTEEMPTDEAIAAQFWLSIRPESTETVED
ncbi:MAG: hypothetical protein LPK45_11280 [Bacteroidota bacterium]|nr:hypothetical protein [Bacteroidota bacterium]MDX5431688.1 hypothetical protein [Bacteroidota bacterium]MDX5470403.1 hypothetical protein [Bacteroidota bacterium]